MAPSVEAHHGLRSIVAAPVPGVAEPQRGQHVQLRSLGAVVVDRDVHEDVGRSGLGVGHLDRPVAVLVERAGVEQLELGVVQAAAPVLGHERLVGELALGIVVAPSQPGVAGQRVEVPPVLLRVLAVVALGPGQPEDPLLEDGVSAVPQRQGQAQALLHVAQPGEPVLVPAVRPRAGVVVRERRPRVTVGAVVLADRTPCPLGEVRPPLVPLAGVEQVALGPPDGGEPLVLCSGVRNGRHGNASCSRCGWGGHDHGPSPAPTAPGASSSATVHTTARGTSAAPAGDLLGWRLGTMGTWS